MPNQKLYPQEATKGNQIVIYYIMKPNWKFLSPLTFKLPEVAAVNAVNPRTTEDVVARGPWCSYASITFSSKYKAPSSTR